MIAHLTNLITKRKMDTGPTRRYMLWFVYSELFSRGRIIFTLLSLLLITMAVLYVLVAGYYKENIYKYNEELVQRNLQTKIVVNCENIRNPSSLFSEEKVRQFKQDPRVAHAEVRLELGVKLGVGPTAEPVIAYAEGASPDSPSVDKSRIVKDSGKGFSSADAREIIITSALYNKLFGIAGKPSNPAGNEELHLSVSRKIGNVEQKQSFSLRVAGVLSHGNWSRVYLPYEFIRNLDLWCDDSIDVIPGQGGSISASLPELAYTSGTFYSGVDTPNDVLADECRHWGIKLEEKGRPFNQLILKEEQQPIHFRITGKDKQTLSKSMIEELSGRLAYASSLEPYCTESLRLYFGGKAFDTRLLILRAGDSRLAGVKPVATKPGANATDAAASLAAGHALVSESFAGLLRARLPEGKLPDRVENGLSMISNYVAIAGTVPDPVVQGDWDLICPFSGYKLLKHAEKELNYQAVFAKDACMAGRLNNEMPSWESVYRSSSGIAGIYTFLLKKRQNVAGRMPRYRVVELDMQQSLEMLTSEEMPKKVIESISEKEPPSGLSCLYAGRLSHGINSYVCLFFPDDFLYAILEKSRIAVPEKRFPLISVRSYDRDDRESEYCHFDARSWAVINRAFHAVRLDADITCFILPDSARKRFCRNAVKVGFVGNPKKLEELSDADRQALSKMGYSRLDYVPFLFVYPEQQEFSRSFIDLYVRHLSRFPLLKLPEYSAGKGDFFVAREKDLARVPLAWSRYQTKDRHGTPVNARVDSVAYIFLAKDVRNDPEVIKAGDPEYDTIDMSCHPLSFDSNVKAMRDVEWADIQCLNDISIKKLRGFTFRKSPDPNSTISRELLSNLKSRYPTFMHVKPDISILGKPSKETPWFDAFELCGSSPMDVCMFQAGVIGGCWLRDDKGIVLPAEMLKGRYKETPAAAVGRNITITFERQKKRTQQEPRLKVNFRVDGVAAGKKGYISAERAKMFTLWSKREVVYVETADAFSLPSQVSAGYSQCLVFAKDLDSIGPIVSDLQAQGYTTYDTMHLKESLNNILDELKMVMVIVSIGPVFSGLVAVTVIMLLITKSRLHETGILLAHGAGKVNLRRKSLYATMIMGSISCIAAIIFARATLPWLSRLLEDSLSIPLDKMISIPLFSVQLARSYFWALAISFGCCGLAMSINYFSIRKMKLADIYRKIMD